MSLVCKAICKRRRNTSSTMTMCPCSCSHKKIRSGWMLVLFFALFSKWSVAQEVNVDTLLNRVFSWSGQLKAKPDVFSAEAYVRFCRNAERRNMFLKLLPGMSNLPKGKSEQFGESLASFLYEEGKGWSVNEYAYFSTDGGEHANSERQLKNNSFYIYDPTLFSNLILSPFNKRNARFYRYKIVNEVKGTSANLVRLNVTPRFDNMQLVKGEFVVELTTGIVKELDLYFRRDLLKVQLQGTMSRAEKWQLLPEDVRIATTFSLFRNTLYSFNDTHLTYAEDSLLYVSSDTLCIERLEYFDSVRPLPLPEDFQRAYKGKATEGGDTAAARVNRFNRRFPKFVPWAESFFMDKRQFKMGERGNVYLPAIITPSMVEWSKSKGLSLRTKVRFNWNFEKGKFLNIEPQVGYNFKQKYCYWDVPLQVNVYPERNVLLGFSMGNGNRIHNSDQTEALLDKYKDVVSYDSLVNNIKKFNFNLYRDFYVRGKISVEPVKHLILSTEARFHKRVMEDWNDAFAASGMLQVIRSFAPSFSVEWTPNRRMPTFLFDYERGVQLARSNSKYEKIEFSARHKLQFYALRALYLRFGAGGYTSRANSYFVDYENFRSGYLPKDWRDEVAWEFQLLNERLYNASRYYVKLSTVYESPMLLISRIPHITKVVQRERIYVNLLCSQIVTPYAELGYGITTRTFDLGCFMSAASGGSYGFGCKISFRLFEDW